MNKRITIIHALLIIMVMISQVFIPIGNVLAEDATESIQFNDFYMYNAVLNLIHDKVTNTNEENLTITISKDNLLGITSLDLEDELITDITGIEKFTNLHELNLSNNKIEDMSLLARLKNLTKLDVSHNSFEDATFLESLTALKDLNIGYNSVLTMESLQGLVNIEKLDISWDPSKYILRTTWSFTELILLQLKT